MAKQLNVNLAFNADTSQAKAAIQSLISDLNKLGKGQNNSSLPLTQEILEAQSAAKQLGQILDKSFNKDVGKLDLTTFNQSLRSSGMTLEQYSTKLSALGKNGDRAFLQVAQSIINTEAPLRRNSKLLSEFTTALKNTARWQISSSVLHGFMGAIQGAYGYAQDLNESLNNIRIVTGANTEQMAAFAKEANNAAKALSTTTTAYTNAALIYYQQGNDDQTVLEKTDVTAKMANVTGQSAQVVSEQLTAIWNNFNKEGDKSYEHFADVLTALGAATASSTDEIAGGLEKFAGIADTIGLSYEYAASALATITATSRESEDVVGTALKTIFARIQGLNLGETLDDGTTLNKYSEALSKVGISIFEQNGELKNMDAILSEMGNKWETLNKDQQMALAQAVAGTRQYNQMMTLMDNWDFMEKNLATAAGSNGELQRQADIYAESWEASKARVKASLEEIYGTLIDDKFFISLNNGFASIIDTVSKFADSIGGVKGVLLLLGNIATRIFGTEISNGINNMIQNIRNASGVAQQESSKLRERAKDIALTMTKDMSSHEIDALRQSVTTTYEAQEKLLAQSKTMSKGQLEVAQNALRVAQGYNDEAIAAGKAADEARRLHEEQMKQSSTTSGSKAYNKLNQYADNAVGQTGAQLTDSARNFIQTAKDMGIVSDEIARAEGALKKYSNELRNGSQNSEKASKAANTLMQSMNKIIAGAEKSSQAFEKFKSKVNQAAVEAVEARSALDSMRTAISNGSFSGGEKEIEALITQLEKAGYDVGILRTNLDNLKGGTDYSQIFAGFVDSTESMNAAIARNANGAKKCTAEMEKLAASAGKAATQQKSAENSFKAAGDAAHDAGEKINNVGLKYKTIGDAANGSLQGLSSFAMGLTSIKSALDALNNPDLSTFEKFTSILMSMSMGIPSLVSSFKVFGDVLAFTTSKTKEGLTAELAHVLGIDLETGAIIKNTGAKGANTTATGTNTVATKINTAAIWKSIAARLMEKAATFALVGVIGVALVGAIYLAVKAYNAESEAANKAAKAAADMAEKSQEAADKVNEIKDAFGEYQSVYDALNNCVKGTEEWNNALQEVNNSVIELIKKYPELSQFLNGRDDNGVLTFDTEAIEKYINDLEGLANNANSAALAASTTASLKKNESSAVDLSRKIYGLKNQTFIDNIEELGKALSPDEFKSKLVELGLATKSTADQYLKYQNSIAQLAAETETTALQIKNVGILVADSQLDDGTSNTAVNIGGQEYTKAYNDTYDDYSSALSGLGRAHGKNDSVWVDGKYETVDTIWNKYQSATGVGELESNALQKKDGVVKFAYKDELGEIQYVTKEVVASAIANAEALSKMGLAADNATSVLSELSTEGLDFSDELASSVDSEGNLNLNDYAASFTESQLANLSSILDEEGKVIVDDLGNISEDFYSTLGISAEEFESIASLFGLSAQELAQMLANSAQEVSSSITEAEKTLLNNVLTDNASVETQKKFVAGKQSVQEQLDNQDLNTSLGNIELDNNTNIEGLSNFYEALAQVDLNSEDATESVKQLAEQYNITGDGVELLIQDIDSLDKCFNIASNDIAAQATSLKEIVGDGLEAGDIVSEEDISKLKEAGINTDAYFSLMEDGSYTLTGAAEEFNEIVNSITFDALLEQVKDFQEAREQVMDNFSPENEAASEYLLDSSKYSADQFANITGDGNNDNGASTELGTARLDYINSFDEGSFDFSGIENATQLLQEYKNNPELELTSQDLATIAEMIDVVNAKESELTTQSLMTATSLEDLDAKAAQLGKVSLQDYGKALVKLASNYDNCEDEIKDYQAALLKGNKDEIKAAQSALKLSTAIGEMAKRFNLDAKATENYAKRLAKNLKIDEEAAAKLAVANQRLDRGLLSLNKNLEDYSESLKENNKNSAAWSETMDAVKTDLADILNLADGAMLSDTFAENTLASDDFKRALDGDVEALQRLQTLAADDIMINIVANQSTTESPEQIKARWDQLKADFEATDISSPDVDQSQLLASFNEMIAAGNMTKDQIEAALAGLHVSANVKTTYVPQKVTVPQTITEEAMVDAGTATVQVPGPDGEWVDQTVFLKKKLTRTYDAGTVEVDGVVPQYEIEGTEGSGGITTAFSPAPTVQPSFDSTTSGSGSGSKGGGGGGGSKSTPAKKTKKSDIVKRYKELEDQLDDTREEADRLRNSLDNLWGDDLAAAAERLIELEERERSLLEQKAEEAKKYLEEDKKALKDAAKDLNITFSFDADGNIIDYAEEMEDLYADLAAMEKKFGDEWSESEQKQIDALKEKISLLEEAMGDYEETRELLEDINIELDEMAGKAVLPEVKSDNFDYFKELNDELDDVEDALEKAQRNYERATSIEDKTKYLQEILTLEQQRLLIMEDQKARAEEVVAEQKLALEQLAELEGIEFEYDKNGNITNYDETIGAMWDEYYELRDSYMDEAGKISPDEQAILDAMKSNIEDLTQYVNDYSEAVEQLEDSVIALDEALGDLPDPYVKADHMDIYKENRDQIDDIEEEIDDARRKADKLTGDARIAALKEVAKLEEKRIQLLKEQKAIAESEIKERKEAMQKIAERNGAVMAIDENGNVTNYIEVMDALLENYEYLANGGDDGLINEAEEIAMEALEKDIKELQEYIDAYCDAVETAEDIQNEIEESAEGGYIDISNLDETIDKLHDINNTLDEIQDALDDSSKAADRLYGSARISQMQKTADLLQKEIGALERKAELQKEIIANEREELNTKASEMGTQFTYDDRGNITNYRAVLEAEKAQIEDMKARLEADGNFSPADEDLIQGMVDNYEDLADAVEEYEQALEDAEDIQNEIQDAFYEWQDLNAEMLSYELELKLQVNDRELAKIERAINRISDDFYQRAEAAAMMIGGGSGGSNQYSTYLKRLNELESQYNKVHQAYLAGEISQAAYVEQTRAIEAEIENVNASLETLQDTMDDYYKNTLSAARQELKFYTDQMSHLTGILNHFKSILQALGKQNDYEMMDRVLRGQVETLENEVQVQKEAMALWKSQADQLYSDYQRELAAGNTENANMYYKAYQEALNAANEAENQYYAKAQQWANALKALMQNTLSDLAQDLENSLTGGTSFDTINTQLKRASSLQEEYLTTTNKIYETTKLMRTAQNEIDKTTNSVAKQKFANFINETKQLQNQNKLSKYELSIQQAKYDLLVAEIALEEARFAKSTVRLQRDSEGNFGYVYTANAEAVANAEQKFEDASNKLYNLALEGANKYVEKYQQTLSEMYDTLTSLQKKYLDGGFESEEEYNKAVLEAKEYYYAKLQDYSYLHQVAITTDSAVIADAWSTDFADMTEKTDQWMQSVNSYLDEVVIAFQEWERESDRIANETVGKDLDALEQNVKDITNRSEELVTQITGPNGVIDAIIAECNEVKKLTDQYASLRGEIVGTITANDALIESMEKDIQASEEAEKGKQDPVTDPTIEENDWAPEQSNDDLDDTTTEDTGGTEPTDPAPPVEEEGKVPDPAPLCSHESGTTVETTPATCTAAGKKVTKCAKCGEVIREEAIAKLGHDDSGSWKHDKTNHWKECKRCGAVIKKAAHTLKDGKCSVCGYKPDSKSNKVIEVGDTPIYKSGKYYHDSYGTSPAGTRGQGKKVKVTQVIKNPKSGQDYPIHVESNDSAYGWLKASQLEGYDTGGYTGAWGSSGKLAMLHEKEIILNKDDTKNFLASLDLLDSILSTIDLHAMNSQFNTMINSPYVSGLAKEALQQNVSIEASFPNATDKKEIEEAFKDLVNLASQYTNRK